jgi:hypothetical protein
MKKWFKDILETYIIPIFVMLICIIFMGVIRCFPFLINTKNFKKECKMEEIKDG